MHSAIGGDSLDISGAIIEHSYAATTQLDHLSSSDVGNTVTVGGEGVVDPAGSITVTVAVSEGSIADSVQGQRPNN